MVLKAGVKPMATLPIAISQPAIDGFCQRHRIRKLSLFGSVLTQRFGPESDVDFLVIPADPDQVEILRSSDGKATDWQEPSARAHEPEPVGPASRPVPECGPASGLSPSTQT